MLEITFFALASLIGLLIYNGIELRKRNKAVSRIFVDFLFLLYILGLLRLTIFPIPVQTAVIQDLISKLESEHLFTYNLIPFSTIIQGISDAVTYNIYPLQIKYLGGNLILLSPFGLYLYFLKRDIQIKRLWLIGIASSLFIETGQLVISFILGFSYRQFDVDDLILNSVGFIFGYFAYSLYQKGIQMIRSK
ncbi:VanZ family protein [Robertmurraya sp. Marseille-Q9965]